MLDLPFPTRVDKITRRTDGSQRSPSLIRASFRVRHGYPNDNGPDAFARPSRRPSRSRLLGEVTIRPLLCWLVALAACGAVVACAADAPAPSGAPVAVRDSAGIRIVESAAPRWRPGEEWRLADTPSVHIKAMGADPEAVLLDPSSVYRATDGRYIIADGLFAGHNQVLVFDSAGRYLDDYGREGAGPCEFRQLWWAVRRAYEPEPITAEDREAYRRRRLELVRNSSEGGPAVVERVERMLRDVV